MNRYLVKLEGYPNILMALFQDTPPQVGDAVVYEGKESISGNFIRIESTIERVL